MNHHYNDILAIAERFNKLTGKNIAPLWWDENGVPRFCEHHPKHCPVISADEVALVRISCQACEREFEVQMSWSSTGEFDENVRAMCRMGQNGFKPPIGTEYLKANPIYALSRQITDGVLHFGDPPYHDCSGATMNCWDLKVMEFWRRGDKRAYWVRVPELESDLPDMANPERATGVPHHPCPRCKKLVADYDGFGVLAHIAPMPDPCGYCTHPSAEVVDATHSRCGICSQIFSTEKP